MPSSVQSILITLLSFCIQKNGGVLKRSLPARVDGDCFKRLLPLKTSIPVYLYAAVFCLFFKLGFLLC